jgi:hypothetical protein
LDRNSKPTSGRPQAFENKSSHFDEETLALHYEASQLYGRRRVLELPAAECYLKTSTLELDEMKLYLEVDYVYLVRVFWQERCIAKNIGSLTKSTLVVSAWKPKQDPRMLLKQYRQAQKEAVLPEKRRRSRSQHTLFRTSKLLPLPPVPVRPYPTPPPRAKSCHRGGTHSKTQVTRLSDSPLVCCEDPPPNTPQTNSTL